MVFWVVRLRSSEKVDVMEKHTTFISRAEE
jgi:hypothetical protein